MDIAENRNGYKDPLYVIFLLIEQGNYDGVKSMVDSTNEPIHVKKVRREMKIDEFFGLFKRFNIALSVDGLLHNREYIYSD